MKYKFDFEDVNLIAKLGIVRSRKECDTSVEFGGIRFKLPVVPATMKTVIDENLATWLAKNEYFYIMHHFGVDQVQFVKTMHEQNLYASISISVQEQDKKLLEKLLEINQIPEFITIDISHGHSIMVKDMLQFIKQLYAQKDKKPFIIAGNIMSPQAVVDLESWGADATKFGIAPGKVCTTKLETGFGTGGWQLSSLNEASKLATKPIVLDGGIRYNGDIAKSIAFGATMIMAGSIFAGYEESPGETINLNNEKFKEYYGSASQYTRTENTHIEGKKILVPLKGSIKDKYLEIEQALKSSISYGGGKQLLDLRECEYVLVKNTIHNGDIR